jgi:hypothetical protein
MENCGSEQEKREGQRGYFSGTSGPKHKWGLFQLWLRS